MGETSSGRLGAATQEDSELRMRLYRGCQAVVATLSCDSSYYRCPHSPYSISQLLAKSVSENDLELSPQSGDQSAYQLFQYLFRVR